MNKQDKYIKNRIITGNYTTINNCNDITPINTTSTVTANLPQKNNTIPKPPIDNIVFTKECVDDNHK